MKAIIVDDEPKAIELIQGYLVHFPQIELVSTFRNSLKALEFLKDNSVDLVFLDINMPHLSGISISRLFHKTVKVIFITAYSEYAPESYEVEAIDYLLKPVSFDRFTKAIHKALKNQMPEVSKSSEEVINLKSGSTIFRILLSDIYYLEKDANYMTYYLTNKKIVVRQSTSEALQELPFYFIQVHKSYIVNCKKISFYSKEEIDLSGKKIPIGNMYRDTFLKLIQNTKLI